MRVFLQECCVLSLFTTFSALCKNYRRAASFSKCPGGLSFIIESRWGAHLTKKEVNVNIFWAWLWKRRKMDKSCLIQGLNCAATLTSSMIFGHCAYISIVECSARYFFCLFFSIQTHFWTKIDSVLLNFDSVLPQSNSVFAKSWLSFYFIFAQFLSFDSVLTQACLSFDSILTQFLLTIYFWLSSCCNS